MPGTNCAILRRFLTSLKSCLAGQEYGELEKKGVDDGGPFHDHQSLEFPLRALRPKNRSTTAVSP